MRRRWQFDQGGVGSDTPDDAVAALYRMATEMRSRGWLTEAPDRHLMPKLRAWLDAQDAWRLESAESVGDWWVLRVRRSGDGRTRDIRAGVFALIGSFAEATTMTRQTETDGLTAFEVVTGQPDEADGFASHGHLVRLLIEPG